MSAAKHTPGRPVQIQGRPRRWGIPTPAQFNLLVDCIEAGGSVYQAGRSLSTLLACQERQWIKVHAAHHKDGDNRADITEQGRACVAMNSQVQA